MRRLLVALFILCALPASANAATYYVSSSGSDSNNGTSTSTPWRTVAKVNSSAVQNALQTGDQVLFKANETYSDAALTPTRSAGSTGYITYSTYNSGTASDRAILPRGIRPGGVNRNIFEDFHIDGSTFGLSQGVFAAAGSFGDDIILDNLQIQNVSIGVQSNAMTMDRWQIKNSNILNTTDSGMILLGNGFYIWNNYIYNIGTSTQTHGKHGIYLKVTGAHVTSNWIENGANGQGVSQRYRGATIEYNTIKDHPHGIAHFDCDSGAGTTQWRNNTIVSTNTGLYGAPTGNYCQLGTITGSETIYVDGNSIDHNNQCYNLAGASGTLIYRVGTVSANTCF